MIFRTVREGREQFAAMVRHAKDEAVVLVGRGKPHSLIINLDGLTLDDLYGSQCWIKLQERIDQLRTNAKLSAAGMMMTDRERWKAEEEAENAKPKQGRRTDLEKTNRTRK